MSVGLEDSATATCDLRPATYFLGLDIGGTKIAGGIVDAATGTVLVQGRVPTMASDGGAAVLARAIMLAERLRREGAAQGLPPVQAVGIGAGGQIDAQTGVVLSATEILPSWAGTRIAESFTQSLQIPAFADNDVNALAAGELRFGAGQGAKNLVFLALGTGVGGAIVSSGKLHQSATGVSGELGHLMLNPGGPPCTCGSKGCLEQYASGPALLRLFEAFGGTATPDDEGNPPPLAKLAGADPRGPAARALDTAGKALGVGLVSLSNIFGPDKIIIGGGLASLGDLLLAPARQVLGERALPPVRQTPVVVAALGADASIVGAACLALPA